MRFGGVRALGRPRGVGGVEVGVERQGVVGVTLQGADAVVVDIGQRVIERIRQHGMGLTSTIVVCWAPALATASLNRTGLRRFEHQ